MLYYTLTLANLELPQVCSETDKARAVAPSVGNLGAATSGYRLLG